MFTLDDIISRLASTLILSEKVDIYSFGVVLFEALCGKPPLIRDHGSANNKIHIVDWVLILWNDMWQFKSNLSFPKNTQFLLSQARPYYEKGAVEEIVDHQIGGNYNASSIWKVAEIAMACAQYEGRKRPTMDEVCYELAEALRLEMSPHTISPTTTGECFPLIDVNARW